MSEFTDFDARALEKCVGSKVLSPNDFAAICHLPAVTIYPEKYSFNFQHLNFFFGGDGYANVYGTLADLFSIDDFHGFFDDDFWKPFWESFRLWFLSYLEDYCAPLEGDWKNCFIRKIIEKFSDTLEHWNYNKYATRRNRDGGESIRVMIGFLDLISEKMLSLSEENSEMLYKQIQSNYYPEDDIGPIFFPEEIEILVSNGVIQRFINQSRSLGMPDSHYYKLEELVVQLRAYFAGFENLNFETAKAIFGTF